MKACGSRLLARSVRGSAIGLFLLLLPASASALTLRYTFDVEATNIADLFALPRPRHHSDITIELDVDDTDLDPNPEAGRFAATRLEIQWDFEFPPGRFSFVAEGSPVFEVRVGTDAAGGDLGRSFLVERVNPRIEGVATPGGLATPESSIIALIVPFNEFLALREGSITEDDLPRSLDLGQFEDVADVRLEFDPPAAVSGPVTSVSAAVVPEPATVVLLAGALLGALTLVRLRDRR